MGISNGLPDQYRDGPARLDNAASAQPGIYGPDKQDIAGDRETKVLYTKRTPRKTFVIVDGGMSDLIRPSLYEAYHKIVPVSVSEDASSTAEKVDVVGPICETGDFLGKDRYLPHMPKGSLVAVMGAGAYGFTMSSNYNSRPRGAEVMVIRNKFYTVRQPEAYNDLVRCETVPKVLK